MDAGANDGGGDSGPNPNNPDNTRNGVNRIHRKFNLEYCIFTLAILLGERRWQFVPMAEIKNPQHQPGECKSCG